MKRKPISKKEREEIYNKTNGRCAYCGTEIDFKGFHADHIKPVRKYENNPDDESMEHIDNKLPACRSCNLYKSTLELEEFREYLQGLLDRLAKQHVIYNIAKRYGMITEIRDPITFYFEKLQNEQENKIIFSDNAEDIEEQYIKQATEEELLQPYQMAEEGKEYFDNIMRNLKENLKKAEANGELEEYYAKVEKILKGKE